MRSCAEDAARRDLRGAHAGQPDERATCPTAGRLPDSQVEPTVELDEILRAFDPATTRAFRQWVQESAKTIQGTGRRQDLNDALGNLAGFAQDGADVLGVLDTAVRPRCTADQEHGRGVRRAQRARRAAAALIENSDHVFSAHRVAADRARARRSAIFPTFLDESKATLARLERFSINAHPLVNDLKPVADKLGPTVQDLAGLSPDLETLFKQPRRR